MRLMALAAGLAISVIPALGATHTQVVEYPTGGQPVVQAARKSGKSGDVFWPGGAYIVL